MKNVEHSSSPSSISFKYHSNISTLKNCPPTVSGLPLAVGYRFGDSDINHPNNGLPVAVKNKNNSTHHRPNCSSYALSMYVSLDTLKARARCGVNYSPQFLKKIGDHYLKIQLSESSGRQTAPNADGHFDLHEYSSFNLQAAVQEHRLLIL